MPPLIYVVPTFRMSEVCMTQPSKCRSVRQCSFGPFQISSIDEPAWRGCGRPSSPALPEPLHTRAHLGNLVDGCSGIPSRACNEASAELSRIGSTRGPLRPNSLSSRSQFAAVASSSETGFVDVGSLSVGQPLREPAHKTSLVHGSVV